MVGIFNSLQPLAANAIFTGSAYALGSFAGIAQPLPMAFGGAPAESDFLSVSCFTDQPGLLFIQQSDDPNNANFWEGVAVLSVAPLTLLSRPSIAIRKRFWRLVYQNTGIAQTQFELVVNGFNTPAFASDEYGNSRVVTQDPYYVAA